MALLWGEALVEAGAVGIWVSSLTHSVCSSMETAQNEELGWEWEAVLCLCPGGGI